MALLGMGDIHYNVCSSCGVLEVPWIHSGTLLWTILDYVGYIITELHGHLRRGADMGSGTAGVRAGAEVAAATIRTGSCN